MKLEIETEQQHFIVYTTGIEAGVAYLRHIDGNKLYWTRFTPSVFSMLFQLLLFSLHFFRSRSVQCIHLYPFCCINGKQISICDFYNSNKNLIFFLCRKNSLFRRFQLQYACAEDTQINMWPVGGGHFESDTNDSRGQIMESFLDDDDDDIERNVRKRKKMLNSGCMMNNDSFVCPLIQTQAHSCCLRAILCCLRAAVQRKGHFN